MTGFFYLIVFYVRVCAICNFVDQDNDYHLDCR
jgi:hypothetical protein